jgi:hypothetical protein
MARSIMSFILGVPGLLCLLLFYMAFCANFVEPMLAAGCRVASRKSGGNEPPNGGNRVDFWVAIDETYWDKGDFRKPRKLLILQKCLSSFLKSCG